MDSNQKSTFYRDPQIMNPVQIGASSILQLSQTRRVIEEVLAFLELLQPDEFIEFVKAYYRAGLSKFGDDWHYTDQITVLFAASQLIRVENYLEIGVFRGRSLSLVANRTPQANLFAFDMWMENYSGMENPGPNFVRSQLTRAGHQSESYFISGPSHETIPAYFAEHSQLFFDMVTVDGDHSEAGARIDLENVLPRIKLGGVLVFDDIVHPKHTILEKVWDEVVGSNPNFTSAKYNQVGHGVAVAVRRDTNAEFDTLRGTNEERAQALASRYKVIEAELQDNKTILQNTLHRLEEVEQDRAARLELIQRQAAEMDKMNSEIRQRDHELRWLPIRALRRLRKSFLKQTFSG